MVGLSNNEVRLIKPSSDWLEQYNMEKITLLNTLHPFNVQIEHIGSTALGTIESKPLIHILIGFNQLEDIEQLPWLELRQKDYYLLKVAIKSKKVMAKFSNIETQTKSVVVHMVEKNSDWWHEHLFFRDYLRSTPSALCEYEALKIRLASEFPDDQASYTDGKQAFVNHILKKRK